MPAKQVKREERAVGERAAHDDRERPVLAGERRHLLHGLTPEELRRVRHRAQRQTGEGLEREHERDGHGQQRVVAVLPGLGAKHERHERQQQSGREEPEPALEAGERVPLLLQPEQRRRARGAAQREPEHEQADHQLAWLDAERVRDHEVRHPTRLKRRLRPTGNAESEQRRQRQAARDHGPRMLREQRLRLGAEIFRLLGRCRGSLGRRCRGVACLGRRSFRGARSAGLGDGRVAGRSIRLRRSRFVGCFRSLCSSFLRL